MQRKHGHGRDGWMSRLLPPPCGEAGPKGRVGVRRLSYAPPRPNGIAARSATRADRDRSRERGNRPSANRPGMSRRGYVPATYEFEGGLVAQCLRTFAIHLLFGASLLARARDQEGHRSYARRQKSKNSLAIGRSRAATASKARPGAASPSRMTF